jgi:hypothetical protein
MGSAQGKGGMKQPSDFAKVYGHGDAQIIVLLDEDERGNPELRLGCRPPNLGVCWMKLAFRSNEKGYELADQAFEDMTEERARKALSGIFDEFGLPGPADPEPLQ